MNALPPLPPDTEDARHARSSEPRRYVRYLDWQDEHPAVSPAEDDNALRFYLLDDAP